MRAVLASLCGMLCVLSCMASSVSAQLVTPTMATSEQAEGASTSAGAPGSVRVTVLAPDGMRIGSKLDIELSSPPAPLFVARRPADEPGVASRDELLRTLSNGFMPVSFESVLPGRPFVVRVLDVIGRELARSEQPSLQPGENRAIEVTLSDAVSGLQVRVLDRDEQPVVGAQLVLLDRSDRNAGASSDRMQLFPPSTNEAGWCGFGWLAREPLTVEVIRSGSVVASIPIDALPAASEPLIVHIDRCRTVKVHVVDGAGAPLFVWSVALRGAHGEWWRAAGDWRAMFSGGTSEWTAEGIPPGEYSVDVHSLDRADVSVTASLDEATVPVPNVRKFRVFWGAHVFGESARVVKVDVLDGAGVVWSKPIMEGAGAGPGGVLLELPPGDYTIRLLGKEPGEVRTKKVEVTSSWHHEVDFDES